MVLPDSLKAGVVLKYFSICGRGEPVRILLEDSGIPYKHIVVDANEETKATFAAEKKDLNIHPFNQIPTLTLDNGKVLAQQDAILRYVCKLLGQAGRGNMDEDLIADQLGCANEDLNNQYVDAIYSDEPETRLKKFFDTYAPKVFAQYEALLNNCSTGYFVYAEPCFGEYTLFYLCHAMKVLKPSMFDGFPVMTAWFEKMASRPGIKAYLASGRQHKNFNFSPIGQDALF